MSELVTRDGVRPALAKKHMRQHAEALPYLAEALLRVDVGAEPLVIACVDLGRVIGQCHLLETTADDEVVYARRIGRAWPTRFVIGRETAPCSSLTAIIARNRYAQQASSHIIISAWIGKPAPREPQDPSIVGTDELIASIDFWSKHALVWGTQEVDQTSIIRGRR